MTAWPEDVVAFANAIRGQAELAAEIAACAGSPIAIAQDIYRNNYRGNLQGALAAAYPVVGRVVGEEFFRMMAGQFIDTHPSHSGNLHHYGAELGDFITSFAPARELFYLADVARLDWACHQAYFAADAHPLDVAQMASVGPARFAALRLLLHPACRILKSKHPIATIWRVHQPGMPDDFHVDLNSGAQSALVARKNGEVRVHELSKAETRWLEQIQVGAPLGAALDTTLALHPEFDLPSTLVGLASLGVLADFELTES